MRRLTAEDYAVDAVTGTRTPSGGFGIIPEFGFVDDAGNIAFRKLQAMKPKDIETSPKMDGAENVFVMRMKTRICGLAWFFAAVLLPAVGFGIYLPYDIYLHRLEGVAALAIWIICGLTYELLLVQTSCFGLLHFFGHREIRIGTRTGSTFVGVGRWGVRRRFAIGPGAWLTTRRWRDYRRNTHYAVILHSPDENEVCLYKPYFTIGRLDDCTLIRRILCANTALKDGSRKR